MATNTTYASLDKLPLQEQIKSPELYRALFEYVCRLTKGNQTDAEDITSEAMFKAWQMVIWRDQDIKKDIPFRRYVMKIARSLWVSQVNKLEVASLHENFYQLAARLLTIESPQERGNLVLEPLQEMISSLPIEKQVSLSLIVYYGYDYKSAAVEMARPTGTIQSQLFRTRKLLKDWIQSENDIDVIPYDKSHLNNAARNALKAKRPDPVVTNDPHLQQLWHALNNFWL